MLENNFEEKVKNKLQSSSSQPMDISSISTNALNASDIEYSPKVKRRRKDVTLPKIGLTEKPGLSRSSFLKRYYARRRILEVPEEILQAHPDKHFIYLNMNKLEKSGMWHSQGYQLFKASEDKDPLVKKKFDNGLDGLIHRNEMVLGWIPQEEHELRMIEQEMVRGRDLSELISKNPALEKFSGYGTSKIEVKNF